MHCHCKWVFSFPCLHLCPGQRALRFSIIAEEIKIRDDKFCTAAVVWLLIGCWAPVGFSTVWIHCISRLHRGRVGFDRSGAPWYCMSVPFLALYFPLLAILQVFYFFSFLFIYILSFVKTALDKIHLVSQIYY